MDIHSLATLQDSVEPRVWRSLLSFLESVRIGQPVDYTTFLLPEKFKVEQLAYAQVMLSKLIHTDIELLNYIEEKESTKFGPFSVRDPWDLRKPLVENYFNQKEVKVSISLRKAFYKIASILPAHSLHSLNLDASFAASPKGKNLGLPAFTRDREYEGEYLRRAKSIVHSGFSASSFPAVLGWRGQPNGSPVHIKNRSVWMMDHVESYISTGVVQPLLHELRSKPGFAAWNDLDHVDRRVTEIIDRAVHNILSVDFSGYDQSLPATIISLSFDLLRYWFTESDARKISWMEETFMQVGLVTPDGIFTGREGGVPSGAGTTNLIDSLGQLLSIHAACIDLGYELVDVEVLGDDGVYSFKTAIDVDLLSSYYEDLYGMKVSSDKGGYSKDNVQFLQRLHYRTYRWHGVCVGIRSIMRTLNGMCHLERLHKGLKPEFFSARLIMQCENARHHPNFKLLVKHIYANDRYLRTLTPEQVFKRAGGVYFVEDVLGLRSFRFTDELPSRGLQQFDTVVELNRLRSGRKDKRHAA